MFVLDLFNTKYEKALRAGAVDKVVSEGGPYDLPGKDYPRPGDAPRRPRPSGSTTSRRHDDDPDFMDPDQRRLRADQERVRKANAEYYAKKNPGVAEGWKEESQDLEDWSKEVNMRLYRAHPSQRLALGKQLSNIEHKHFGSEIELFKNGKQGYTRIVSAALKALQSGDMVHYDPGKVGAMPFGSLVGDDAKEIAAANLHASESEGYGILKRNRIVDTINDFLRLADVVRTLPPEYLFKYKDAGGQAWFEIVKDIRWSKDDAPGKKYRVSQGMAEDQDNPYGYRKGQTVKLDNGQQGRVIDIFDDSIEVLLVGGRTVTVDFRNAQVISEQGIAEGMERAVDAHGRTQTQWAQLVKSKFPDAKITQAKMIDGPMQATLPDGRKIGWSKVEQGIAEGAPISGDGGAVDNFRQQMANNTELAYQKGMAEARKKKKKKSSRSMQGYFFPGYGYYGGGDSGEGGGGEGGESVNEFAAGGGGGSGDYFQALASAWYNGAFDTGSLQKGIKSKEDVERLLNRGIIGPDGVTRKYAIDYNSTFEGVVISSDDYYEHADYNDQGQEVDSRNGRPWGPYDYMEFDDEELDESAKYRDPKYKGQLYTQKPPDYNDTREYDNARFDPKPKGYPGRKKLPGGGEYDRTDPLVRGAGIGRSGIKHNINLSGKRKGLPSRDQITSLKQSIKDISGQHTRANLPEQGDLNELSTDKLARYKTAAGADASAADKRGDYARGNKRFKGIVKATIKQGNNDAKKHTPTNEESSTASDAVERAVLNRIMVAHTDLLMQFGPEKVMQAAEEVAYNVGDVDEIGTSDVSAYVNQVKQILGA